MEIFVGILVIIVFGIILYFATKQRVKQNEEQIIYSKKQLRIHEELLYQLGYFHALKGKPMNFKQCLKDLEDLKKEVEQEMDQYEL